MGSGFEWAPLERLRSRTSAKWRVYPENVLPLWVAEMDVELAPTVRDALIAAIAGGDTGYPYGSTYAQAFDRFAERRWGWTGLSVQRSMIVADVMTGITEVLRLITDPGDAVIVTPPVYPPFYAFPTNAGRRVLEAPLTSSGRLDLDTLQDAFVRAARTSRQATLLLSNPHNPTGVVHTREELEAVAQLAAGHRVRIVADEIHAPLVLPGAHFVPFLSVPGSENGFSVLSASKAWNLAGLKAGLVIAGEQAVDDLGRMSEEVKYGASHLGILAHTAALNDESGWLDDLLVALAANRTLLASLLSTHLPQVGCLSPQGTYLAWLDCSRTTAAHDPATVLRERAHVALNPGPTFGSGGGGHVRLNFATSPEILSEAVERMAGVLS